LTTLQAHAAERTDRLAGSPTAVEVRGLSKTFRIPHRVYSTFKERALHPLSARTYDELRALDDVSFYVRQGEFFGIVGRNGSGKSTLLKCLAGIYLPDRGTARLRGRLSPFIELGVGFNPDLAARDNVMINAVLLGLSRREAQRRFDSIIAFAELEEFVELKLKNYSSGMSVRLAFSTAIQVDADVLLVDEVLAVGDASFQAKCFEQFHRLKREGKTIVFVTHDMSAVERFCDRAMLVERGRLVEIGAPDTIARAYNELNFGRLAELESGEDSHESTASAAITAAWFENASGERAAAIPQGEPLRLCFETRFSEREDEPVLAWHLRNEVRHTIFATSSTHRKLDTGSQAPGDVLVARVSMENWLAPGRYTLTPTVARNPGGPNDVLDVRADLATLIVYGTGAGGIIDVPHEIELERS
jgi:ABC-type polysaccharide/polyol phosphate transport system ATPase subunit